MEPTHIIIQAGGKGTRLGSMTQNKPKGIVPVNNKPIIFNLFQQFPKCKFIIIGDYLFDVLEKYMYAFCDVQYLLVKANGTGTCGGIKQALDLLPSNEPFMLVWSDLILSEHFIMDQPDGNYVGISKDFSCRWSYKDERFIEQPSMDHGVAGLFLFQSKIVIEDVPQSGELVKWLGEQNITFNELPLYGTKEVGTIDNFHAVEQADFRCRPFNQLIIENDVVTKKSLDKQGEKLAQQECAWYKEVRKYEFKQIPEIIGYAPLQMRKINGVNIFKQEFTLREKMKVVDNLIFSLSELHNLKRVPKNVFSIQEAYFTKTMKRLDKVRDLIPFANQEHIVINGKRCRNVFFHQSRLQALVSECLYHTDFALIHGDCTFSNTMVDSELNITFLDPRGYFGFTELYGDIFYDWSKVYYSIYGDYDQFNNKHFTLAITSQGVNLEIATNGWKDVAPYFIENIPNSNEHKIKLLHAIIWLSLTTYAWEDYDSICGAFYNGTYYLEDLL